MVHGGDKTPDKGQTLTKTFAYLGTQNSFPRAGGRAERKQIIIIIIITLRSEPVEAGTRRLRVRAPARCQHGPVVVYVGG